MCAKFSPAGAGPLPSAGSADPAEYSSPPEDDVEAGDRQVGLHRRRSAAMSPPLSRAEERRPAAGASCARAGRARRGSRPLARTVRRGGPARCRSAPSVTTSNTSGAGPPGGEDGAGHARLPPADPLRHAGLEQLHDLTGRPGVDVRRDAFADLLPQGSPHPPSFLPDQQHRRRVKENPSHRCCECHDRFPPRRDLRPVRYMVRSLTQVRLWTRSRH